MAKLRVGVIYGGRSGEHEVSVASAASIIRHLDRARYEPVPLRIEKDGRWTLAETPPTAISAAAVIDQARLEAALPTRRGKEAHLVAQPGADTVMTIERRPTLDVADSAAHVAARSTQDAIRSATDDIISGAVGAGSPTGLRVVPPGRTTAVLTGLGLDVVFPVLHGPYGEDGTVQGLLELANVPYVGAGVLGSAVGMDKAVMKTLFAARGLPIAAYLVILRCDWDRNREALSTRVERELGFPVFVKPANLGSSVGISKARTAEDFVAAMALALQFDRKVVVEAAVPEAREIECAVLGNDEPEASVAGEVVPSREFYDYEAKYLDEGSQLLIPAPLGEMEAAEIRRLAVEAFRAVEGAGMARIDFLVARQDGTIYVSEVNTIPGFTTISMYPKLWEATGLAYPELIDRLISLALQRHAEKQQLRTSVT